MILSIVIQFQEPTTPIAFFVQLKPRKSTTFSFSPSWFSPRLRKSVCSNSFTSDNRARSPKTMTESNRTSAFRSTGHSEISSSFNSGGHEVTLNRLSKWLVTALFGAVILWRHDADALWAAMGSVLNVSLSTILKKILNQERPASSLRSDPGMPSSHSQSIFFAATFSVLSVFQWIGVNGLAAILSGLVLALGSYLSFLRVSQKCHTLSQIVVGAAIGSAFCIFWFWLWNAIILKAFISLLWVRIIVVMGSCGFCVSFFLYIIRYWIMDSAVNFVNRMIES